MPSLARRLLKSPLVLAAFFIGTLLSGAFAATDSTWILYDKGQMTSSVGTASLNSATATYTTWQPLITITPNPSQALMDVRIVLDLDKSSTGVATRFSSQTIQYSIGRKVDGTNLRTANNLATTALSGTNSAGQSVELFAGLVGPTEILTVQVKASSMTGVAAASIPFTIYYRSVARATVTPAQ